MTSVEVEAPAGWVLIHHRAFNSPTLYFGPFADIDEVEAWLAEHPDVAPMVIPMFKTVDWMR